ncbi:hypothetical protein NKH85_19740 [Mesorhizobium sp. M0924]|uniref:hypothetical protein n=1 Tax=unclassified Mesorhizobium TaxID=325217 RepID=UPI00333A5006
MKPMIATESEQPEIYATVRREMPAIHGALSEMGKQMRGLSPLSQKAAIAELTAIRCLANYPDDLDRALSLAEAIHHQADIYLRESENAGGARH